MDDLESLFLLPIVDIDGVEMRGVRRSDGGEGGRGGEDSVYLFQPSSTIHAPRKSPNTQQSPFASVCFLLLFLLEIVNLNSLN
jgi:hypothetical protein